MSNHYDPMDDKQTAVPTDLFDRRVNPGSTAQEELDKLVQLAQPKEEVDHPAHYGGADNPYEVIKVIEYYRLGFALGNCIKYILRAGRKDSSRQGLITDLKKAAFYLNREIQNLEQDPRK